MKHQKNALLSGNGNLHTKTKAAVGATLLALTLAGSATGDKLPAPVAVTAPAPNPELSREALNSRVSDTAQSFAKKILERYALGGTNTTKQVTESQETPGNFQVNMDINKAQAGKKRTNYNLFVTLQKNEFGQMDPTTVSQVLIGINAHGTRGDDYFGLGFIKIPNDDGQDDWRIVNHLPNIHAATYDSTEPQAFNGDSVLQPLRVSRLSRLTALGLNVLEQAVEATDFPDKVPMDPFGNKTPGTTIPAPSGPSSPVPTTRPAPQS